MKNLLIRVVVLGSLVASGALADGAFIGVEGGYNFKNGIKSSIDAHLPLGEVIKADDKKYEYGIKAGYDFGLFRAYGGYYQQSSGKDEYKGKPRVNAVEVVAIHKWKTKDFIIGSDFTPQITENFKFIIGAYGGYSKLDVKRSVYIPDLSLSFSIDNKESMPGWLIGAKIGAAFSFLDHHELELGFKTSKTWYDADGKHNFRDIDAKKHGVYLGYNFKF